MMYVLCGINNFLSLLKNEIVEFSSFVVCLYYIKPLNKHTVFFIVFLSLLLSERMFYNLLDFFLNKLDG